RSRSLASRSKLNCWAIAERPAGASENSTMPMTARARVSREDRIPLPIERHSFHRLFKIDNYQANGAAAANGEKRLVVGHNQFMVAEGEIGQGIDRSFVDRNDHIAAPQAAD